MQKNPHLLIEGCVIGVDRGRGQQGLHLHPRRVRAPGRHPGRRASRRPTSKRLPRRAHPRLRALVRAGRCTAARAPTSAARRPALLDALEGKRGNPRLKPPFPANQGLYQGPTLINNVETLCNAPLDHRPRRRSGSSRSARATPRAPRSCPCRATCSAPATTRSSSASPRARSCTGWPAARPRAAGSSAGSRAAPRRRCCWRSTSTCPTPSRRWPRPARCSARAPIIVVDDSQPLVPLALRLAGFYRHESCGKCVPCREGTNWTVKMLERVDSGEATPDGPRDHGPGPGEHHGQLPVRARRLDGDADRLDAEATSARSSRSTSSMARSGASSRHGRPRGGLSLMARPEIKLDHASRSTAARCRRPRARCSWTPPSTATWRSPTSVTSRSSASPWAPAACAWWRSRASRSSRPPAPPRCATGWWWSPPRTACGTPRTRSWSSCWSTTRSTARCATRAASARSRTSRSAGAPGRSRYIEPKRHFKKPLELSPLVAIDRERCILCYRCVRFSQEVAEDNQLVFLERGDHTFVGTHDGRPYVGAVQRQHHRALPGGRAHLHLVPLPRASLGHRGRRQRLRALPLAVQRDAHDPRRRQGRARARARQRRGGRRLALRQGPLRLPVVRRRGAHHRADGARRRVPARGVAGSARCPRPPRRSAKAGAEHGRLRERADHQRGGLPRPAADARRPRLGLGGVARRLARPTRRRRACSPVPTSPRGCRTSTTPTRSWWWAPSWWTRRRSSTCACARPCGATAPGS